MTTMTTRSTPSGRETRDGMTRSGMSRMTTTTGTYSTFGMSLCSFIFFVASISYLLPPLTTFNNDTTMPIVTGHDSSKSFAHPFFWLLTNLKY